MILNGKTQLGLAFDRFMQDELFRLHYDKYISKEEDPAILIESVAQVQDMMMAHLESMLAFFGPKRGLVRFRKHATKYISPYGLTKSQRKSLLTIETAEDFNDLLVNIMAAQQEEKEG